MDVKEILKHVDHTLLKQTATWEDIKQICDDGIKYGCASVCIPQTYVNHAAHYVAEQQHYGFGQLPICTVIGFPNGYTPSGIKCMEAESAVADGATEIDMVINTSTGFASGGATREDVALMAAHMTNGKRIKAAGGIASLQDAEDFLKLGADRLGTSRIVKAVKELEAKGEL